MRRLLAWFGFGFGFLFGASGHAAGPLSIELTLENCPDVDRSEVERVLAAELGVHLDATAARSAAAITASCNGSRLVLEVSDPISRKTLRRRFDLAGALGPGKSRLVAIAASELVLASWAELELHPEPRVEPEGPAPSAETAALARERLRLRAPLAPSPAEAAPPNEPVEFVPPRRRWFELQDPEARRLRVVMLGSMRRFTDRDGTLWGGGFRVGQEPFVATSWGLDLLFETGEIRDRADRGFSIDNITLGGQLLLAAQLRPVVLRAGIGLRAGLVVSALSGDENSRTTAVAPWGWPFLALSATLRLHRSILELAGEGGYVALPVSQSSTGTTILRGVWVGAQVGVGVMP